MVSLEVLSCFSLKYLHCQQHHSCALGPLISKIRVTGTPALGYHNSWSDNRVCYEVTNRWIVYTVQIHWGMIHVSSRREQEGKRFLHAMQNGMQFKTFELFISGIFHLAFLDHSGPQLTTGNWNHRKRTHVLQRDYCMGWRFYSSSDSSSL